MTSAKMQVIALLLAVCFTVGYGKSPLNRISKRIKGGEAAKIAEFPHQVSIRKQGKHICGGTILDETHILTAAHCFVKKVAIRLPSPSNFKVLCGTNNNQSPRSGQEYPVKTYYVHSNFNYDESYQDDVAIIKLSEPIVFNRAALPIDLPKSDISVNSKVTASGWGASVWKTIPDNTKDLKKIDLKVVNNEFCSKVLGTKIHPGQLCAFKNDGEGMCVGDSGGPLVSNDEVVGIVSWGKPCGVGVPDVFTRVWKYVDWINKYLAT